MDSEETAMLSRLDRLRTALFGATAKGGLLYYGEGSHCDKGGGDGVHLKIKGSGTPGGKDHCFCSHSHPRPLSHDRVGGSEED